MKIDSMKYPMVPACTFGEKQDQEDREEYFADQEEPRLIDTDSEEAFLLDVDHEECFADTPINETVDTA